MTAVRRIEGPTDVLLLDFDGVIRHWRDEPVHEIERTLGLPIGSILGAAHSVPEYERGVLGEVSFADWCAATQQALAAEYGQTALLAVDQWRRYRGDLDAEVMATVARIGREMPVALLSNAHDCLRSDLASFGIAGLFVEVVCSAEEGLAKPDPELFDLTCRRLGVEPDQMLFVDDRRENIEGAQAAGLRAELFVDASQLAGLTARQSCRNRSPLPRQRQSPRPTSPTAPQSTTGQTPS
jgi:putative hydrolase of the HAD superfamily